MKKTFFTWKKIIALILVLTISGGAIYWFTRPATVTPVQYTSSQVTKSSISVEVNSTGTVVVTKQLNAGFRVAGRISEIDVKIGDHIAVGQQIAKIETTTLENQVSQSQSNLNQANNNLQNKYVSGKYTYYDILNLQEAIKSAQIKLNTDQDNLKAAVLTSSMDGIVTSVNNSVGDSVSGAGSNSTVSSTSSSASSSSNSGVVTIVDFSSLQISLTVGESDISKVAIGQAVQISFDALGDKKYVGKVETIDSNATVSSNIVSYGVKVSLAKIDSDIKPGMTANASILTKTKDNVLLVPNAAVKSVNGQKTVQILSNNKPQTVNVKVGLSNDTETEITEGVSEGDTVVTGTVATTTSSSTTGQSATSILGGAGGAGGARTFNGGGR